MYNIYPIGDLKEHILDSSCWCDPQVIMQNDEMLIVHNSADGREAVEMANEIINGNLGLEDRNIYFKSKGNE